MSTVAFPAFCGARALVGFAPSRLVQKCRTPESRPRAIVGARRKSRVLGSSRRRAVVGDLVEVFGDEGSCDREELVVVELDGVVAAVRIFGRSDAADLRWSGGVADRDRDHRGGAQVGQVVGYEPGAADRKVLGHGGERLCATAPAASPCRLPGDGHGDLVAVADTTFVMR